MTHGVTVYKEMNSNKVQITHLNNVE